MIKTIHGFLKRLILYKTKKYVAMFPFKYFSFHVFKMSEYSGKSNSHALPNIAYFHHVNKKEKVNNKI